MAALKKLGPRGNTMDSEVVSAYIRQQLKAYLINRYHQAFLKDSGDLRFTVNADYDITKFAWTIRIRSCRGFEVALFCDESVLNIGSREEWTIYQLQALEPLMDTLIFNEWFYDQLPDEDKPLFREKLQGRFKSCTYLPPPAHPGTVWRSRYGDGQTVAPDWLAVVTFDNGAKRREILSNIANDATTWLSMLLMISNNRKLGFGNA